ncbi:MAG TPA: molybdopterin-dependent oxidoreductase, partial [Nevskiaceae bacterium]|nr:molybdopterin-dependent oxidoreductase [Nevskiaceae bacterium]
PVRTTCPYCGVGCGVLATRKADGTVTVTGDPAHPANRGRLCVKGSALDETVGLDGRLLFPMERGADGVLSRVSWDEALDQVAQAFADTIAQHGPDAVAFYVSGQILTEDYYVANKLMKGFIGSANIDTNSRLCMSSAVAGHKRAFGEDVVPVSYEDLETADLVVLVGSNTAWCHPILFQRLVAAKKARPELQVVVVDPRATATCDIADLHLPVKPGTDVALFNGLLTYLHDRGIVDVRFVREHTSGVAKAVATAEKTAGSVAHVARACGLSEEALRRFYDLYARTARTVTAFSMGVNQSSSGTDKVNAIINCHLLTGRIGKPGAGPFSITGQPNAMGGREVGGLANMLAAHMDLADATHREVVQSFWASPRIAQQPGLKAVDLFNAIDAGKVKALWIMATNPVVSLPDADLVRRALSKCDFVVASDVVRDTDTNAYAHVLLPGAAWGEKDGTVTNSERCVSRQRAFLPLPGEARPDWWALCEVARRMGFGEGFAFGSAHEVFLEHARLTAYRNGADGPRRALNLAGLADLDRNAYDRLSPQRWPILSSGAAAPRLFADGCFPTPDGRARFVPLVPRAPANAPDDEYPLILNTGRVRDQWHTMTRTGRSPRLSQHIGEPYVEIHPHDAMLWGVRDKGLARITSRWGACVVRVNAQATTPRRQLFVPIHWNAQTASDARIGALVNPAVDPISGEPEFKHTPVRIEPFIVNWHGFALLRETDERRLLASDDPAHGTPVWWTRIRGERFVRVEFAGRGKLADLGAWARAMLGAADDADWIEAHDVSEGTYRAVHLAQDRLDACLFLSPRPEDLPARAWLSGLFEREVIDEIDRLCLLAGTPLTPGADTGPTVCACFGVGRNTILGAVKGGCATPEALGQKLRCGTNCGSCVPELRTLIREVQATETA